MSINLQYHYAIIDDNYCCTGYKTCTYEVPLDNFILIPSIDDGYIGKYYNPTDGLFYYELEYINVFDPEA